MDILDKLALFLIPHKTTTKQKVVKEEGDVVVPKKERVSCSFNRRKECFAEKNFKRPDKIYNDQFTNENPYYFRPDRRAKNLIKMMLPFMHTKFDWAEWTYRNRYGVFITVGLYLAVLMGFSMVSFKLDVNNVNDGILIDLKKIEEFEALLEQMKKEETEQQQTEKVTNKISDVNSNTVEDYSFESYSEIDPINSQQLLDESIDNLMDSRQMMRHYMVQMDKIDDEIKDAVDRFRRENDSTHRVAKDNENLHSIKKGNVTVSYDLEGRRALHLEVPAYLCRGGGKVIVEINVNRMGSVVSAAVKRTYGVNDPCVEEMAVWAAKQSLFDVNNAAEARQKGTMTYIFVAQ